MARANLPIGILLAAGFSRRFGVDDKLLHPLPDGTPLALAAARNLVQALPRSVAVVRPDNERLARLLQESGLRVVRCPGNALGMGDTLATGIAHAMQAYTDRSGFVIALADMPSIQSSTITAVAERIAAGASIAAPCFHGRRGHPVGFAETLGETLAGLGGDEGARSVIQRNREHVVLVECDDPGVLIDIDTPEDLPKLGRAG